MEPKDVETIKKLSKQLKTIKIMLAVFLVMVLVNIAALAFIAWTVVMFTRHVTEKVDSFPQSLLEVPGATAGSAGQTGQSAVEKICGNQLARHYLGDTATDFCKEYDAAHSQ